MDLAEACLLAILQVQVTDNDIKLQGESLHDTLSRYFVAPEMRLMPQSFWDGGHWNGFKMKLKVTASRVQLKRSVICATKPQHHIVINHVEPHASSAYCLTLLSPSSKSPFAMHHAMPCFAQWPVSSQAHGGPAGQRWHNNRMRSLHARLPCQRPH